MSNLGTCTLYIPTRGNSKWLPQFLHAYRKNHIEPLYVVDSDDADTISCLKALDARMVVFERSIAAVEFGKIRFGAEACKTDWVLRIDDDEFPSAAFTQWIKSGAHQRTDTAWYSSVREVQATAQGFAFAIWLPRVSTHTHYNVLNPMLRLFNRRKVQFTEAFHSAGFTLPGTAPFLPGQYFIIHCNNVVRSMAERVKKLRHYADIDTAKTWRYAHESLPELFGPDDVALSSDGLEEFHHLLVGLRGGENEIVTLAPQEVVALKQGMFEMSIKSLSNAMETIEIQRSAMAKLQARLTANKI
jgi:hypothetical protein